MALHGGKFKSVLEWAWQGERWRQLAERRASVSNPELIEEARGAGILAWRVLAGLEPVAASTRAVLALAVLEKGLKASQRALAPHKASFAELFDEPEWRERFVKAGLSEAQQASVKAWLEEPGGASPSQELAKSSLVTLRAALDSLEESDRALRRVLWRRLGVIGMVLMGGAAAAFLVFTLLKPPRPPDLAANKPWKASSAYPGFSLSGLKPERPMAGLFFSTNDEQNPWWQVDLQAPLAIGAVEVENRSDCCGERAQPLVIELSLDGEKWREVARRDTTFRVWTAKFPESQARYVRVRLLRRTNLHLRNVSVFASSR